MPVFASLACPASVTLSLALTDVWLALTVIEAVAIGFIGVVLCVTLGRTGGALSAASAAADPADTSAADRAPAASARTQRRRLVAGMVVVSRSVNGLPLCGI
ncbi:hypothetical protein GCM10014715_21860 [Streptomyces spiralis]|uniref:Uncharacterized protein n=1 Tax=Streptomyces spiralis TaxID=66376 RepID=A0A918ZSH6_9ACTN|nr:hypothetical protein GCM10014715_21860 [Streptomyces spiralis]